MTPGVFLLRRPTASCGSSHVFANDPWMSRGNAQERQSRPFWLAAILLPVAKGVHADTERLGELSLRQPDEATQRSHVARLKLAAHDALPLIATQGSREIRSAEFGDGFHDYFSMYSR